MSNIKTIIKKIQKMPNVEEVDWDGHLLDILLPRDQIQYVIGKNGGLASARLSKAARSLVPKISTMLRKEGLIEMKLVHEINKLFENKADAIVKKGMDRIYTAIDTVLGKREMGSASDGAVTGMSDFLTSGRIPPKGAWKDEIQDHSKSRLRNKEINQLLKASGKSKKDLETSWSDGINQIVKDLEKAKLRG